ncbi:hypothetical protein Xoosp13_192 [Xanthomonas phage Xoo-sp13]|nr:hypothetical protein Xoosp13_192 [Xanthomonas phage Xoo-sp13]
MSNLLQNQETKLDKPNNVKSIIFDIDDTCGDLKLRLRDIYRRATGDDTICYTHWDDYGVKDRYGITSDQLSTLFIEDQSLQLMKPHDGLVEVISSLKSDGYNIEFVTARGWHPDGYNVTQKWLEDNQVYYDRINIVPLHQCKEEATRHIENIVLFVDDRHDHCLNMVKSGRVQKSLLFTQPWNKHLPVSEKLVPITTLYDVLEHLPEN